MTAVSLGATTGGGKTPSKGEDFKVALTALGEGWLLGDSGNAAGEENQAERPKGKGAAVRVSTEIPCQLQVGCWLITTLLSAQGLLLLCHTHARGFVAVVVCCLGFAR